MSRRDDTKILVAVDFGTTCSGLAWALTKKPRAQEIIQEWPDVPNTDDKVPTTLKYDNGDLPVGPYRWGFQIDEEEMKHEWFKLGLYPRLDESELSRKYPSTTALPRVYGSKCEKLVTAYLRSLRKHADKVLEDRVGRGVLATTPREYIVTVPAMWSEQAQDVTRACAEKAGMGAKDKIQIISEPEAAGIYALDTMTALDLRISDTFVVCDAGGGTVDLVSYTVSSLKPTPTIRETAPGAGGLCGSIFLNRIFAAYLQEKFQDYPHWDNEDQAEAMKRFENDIKRKYTGDTTRKYFLPARAHRPNRLLGFHGGKLELAGQVIHDVFEEVVKEILKLVRVQIDITTETLGRPNAVKAVLLAGGFGRNSYLRDRIEMEVGPNIKVRMVPNTNTSIVRGALLRGLTRRDPGLGTIVVESRVARKSYGTCAYTEYQADKHDFTRIEPNTFTGGSRILVMQWFVRKGQALKESETSHFKYSYDEKVSERGPGTVEMTIYVCETPRADGGPLYRDPTVAELLKLKIDLSKIPKSELPLMMGSDGDLYNQIYFEIHMEFHSANLTFTMVHNNKKYHTVQKQFV